MKTPSTDLFILIKSLTPQEKKYFKQLSRVYSDDRENSYELLFDAIEAQQEYDEAEIKQKFKGYGFINQLSVAKNYLYDKILDALYNQHSEVDDMLQIERMIGRVEILMRRNLMKQALQLYEKTEERMLEMGTLTLLPHLTRQKNLIISRLLKQFDTNELIKNGDIATHHANVLHNYLQYENLQTRLNIIFSDSKLQERKEIRKQLDELMQHPLMKDEKNALSLRSRHFFIKSNYRYLTVKGQWKEAEQMAIKFLAELEKVKRNTREWQVTYMGIFIDIVEIALHEHNQPLCEKMMKKYGHITKEKFYNHITIQQEYFMFMLDYFAEFEIEAGKALAFYAEHEKWWLSEQSRMNVIICFRSMFNLMRVYFLAGKYQECIMCFHRFMELKTLNTAEPRARILWLMVQYEIRNMELLKNQSKNVMDWFKKHSTMNEMEKAILLFFEKLPKARDKQELRTRFTAMQQTLHKLKAANPNNSFRDFERWVEKKIENPK